jgi:predicted AlkP superfamily pyrophosphatase or phosphodiesterase
MPSFASLLKKGTLVKSVREIYPSLTYPSHTTIVTGMYPKNHMVVDNTLIQPKRFLRPDWYWWSKYVKTSTLYQLAAKQGMKVASFLWPVTAGSKEIKYNVAEIFPNRIWENQYTKSFSASSPLFLIALQHRFGELRDGIKQPNLDEFITASAVWTIETKKPDLTMIHLVDLDSQRHRYGVESPQALQALTRLDEHLDRLIAAYQGEDINIVVTGDHYQINVSKMIHLNSLFKTLGWLEYDADKMSILNWKVLAKTTDGSTYIYVKDESLIPEVKDKLEKYVGKYIDDLYRIQEIRDLGADSSANFMLEAKRGYYFTDEVEVAGLIEDVNPDELGQPHRYKALHGYSPDKKKYATTSFFYGDDVNVGKIITKANLIDVAPTVAQLMGLSFPNQTDGQVIKGVFKSEK